MSTNFEVGQAVTWLYTARGGYGYTIPVKAVFYGITASGKAHIGAEKKGGKLVTRFVDPANLREAK